MISDVFFINIFVQTFIEVISFFYEFRPCDLEWILPFFLLLYDFHLFDFVISEDGSLYRFFGLYFLLSWGDFLNRICCRCRLGIEIKRIVVFLHNWCPGIFLSAVAHFISGSQYQAY